MRALCTDLIERDYIFGDVFGPEQTSIIMYSLLFTAKRIISTFPPHSCHIEIMMSQLANHMCMCPATGKSHQSKWRTFICQYKSVHAAISRTNENPRSAPLIHLFSAQQSSTELVLEKSHMSSMICVNMLARDLVGIKLDSQEEIVNLHSAGYP